MNAKKLILILLTTITFSHQAYTFDLVETLYDEGKKQIGKLEITSAFPLVNYSPVSGLNFDVRYRLKFMPAYVNSNYLRLDVYKYETGIDTNSLFKLEGLPFGVTLSHGSEIVFARQYPTLFKDAIKDLKPYTLKNLPIKSKWALENLNPGDFVSIDAKMNIVISKGANIPIASAIYSVYGSVYSLVSGDFRVQFFKLDDSRMRVKIIALKNDSKGINFGIGPSQRLKITGINVLDKAMNKQILKYIDINPINLGLSGSDQELFLIDYIFNLTDPTASEAYDNLMKKLNYQELKLINPLKDRDGIEKELYANIEDVENIYKQDADKEIGNQRIARIFKGKNDSSSSSTFINLGLNLAKLKDGVTYSRQQIASVDSNEATQRYIFDTFTHETETLFLFKLFGETARGSMHLLLDADRNFKPTKFKLLALTRERTIKSMSYKEQERIKQHLKLVLGEEIYSKINFTGFNSTEDKTNVLLRTQLVFKESALALMPDLSFSVMKEHFISYLKRGPRYWVTMKEEPYEAKYGEVKTCSNKLWYECYMADIDMITVRLIKAFEQPKVITEEELRQNKISRLSAFLDLRKYPLFEQVGPGFLIYLIKQSNVNPEDVLQFKLSWNSSETRDNNVEFKYPEEQKDSAIFETVVAMQSILTNSSDVREQLKYLLRDPKEQIEAIVTETK